MKVILSIIIPIYNVEYYLEECLNSIVDWYVDGIEVILVNDGSTDRSLAICEKYQKKYPFIILFSQINKGLSAARNKGLQIAKGEYVWWIDGDDYIECNALTFLVHEILVNPKDVMRFGFLLFDDISREEKLKLSLTENKNTNSYEYFQENEFLMQACFGVYKRNFLKENSIAFCEGLIFEDVHFSIQVYSHNPSMSILKEVLYLYRAREGSLLRSAVNEKKLDSVIAIIHLCDDIISKKGIENGYLAVRQMYDNIVLLMDMLTRFPTNLANSKLKMINNNVPIISSDSRGLKFMKTILRFFPGIFFRLRLHLSKK